MRRGRGIYARGTLTGTTYPFPIGGRGFDGATDGTHNYLVAFDGGNVFQLGLDWTNPVQLFNVGSGSTSGYHLRSVQQFPLDC